MNDVSIRPVGPGDGPALAELVAASPDGGRVSSVTTYTADPVRVFRSMHPNNEDFVAVTGDGVVVGTCGMYSHRMQYEGALVDAVHLHSLMVHPGYRGAGLGSMMGEFRIHRARERFGTQAVLYAFIQQANTASERVSATWRTQVVPRALRMRAFTPLRTAPSGPAGVVARVVEASEFSIYAQAANAFFADYNGYPVLNAETMGARVALSPVDRPIFSYIAAFDPNGELVAGMEVDEQFRARLSRIVRMPGPLRFVGRITGMLPPDGVFRMASAWRLWYTGERRDAALYLVNWLRHSLRNEATTIVCPASPRGPLARIPGGRLVSSVTVATAGPPWSASRLMA